MLHRLLPTRLVVHLANNAIVLSCWQNVFFYLPGLTFMTLLFCLLDLLSSSVKCQNSVCICLSRWLEYLGPVGTMQQRVWRRDTNPNQDLSVPSRGVIPLRRGCGRRPALQPPVLQGWAPHPPCVLCPHMSISVIEYPFFKNFVFKY